MSFHGKVRYILLSPFFTAIILNLELTWCWSANHACPLRASASEINMIIHHITQLFPVLVWKGGTIHGNRLQIPVKIQQQMILDMD